MIKFLCPHCSQKIGVAAQHAGKKVRCTKCTQPVTIPASSQASPAPKPSAPPPTVQKPPAAPKTPVPDIGEETDELSLKMEPMGTMDDLLNMEKQMQAVERVASLKGPQGPAGPDAAEATSELMRLQAIAAGRRQAQEPGEPVNKPVLMTVCAIGAISSLIVLAAIAVFLFVPPPQRSYADAEAFVRNFMHGRQDIETSESDADSPAIAEPNAAEPNTPDLEGVEPDAAGSDVSAQEPAEPQEATPAVDDSDEIGSAAAAAERSPRSRPDYPEAETRLPYGPELVAAMAEEQEQVRQYLERHKDDDMSLGAMGAIERMSPISSGLNNAMSLIYSEPSLTLVRSVQCHMPDSGQSAFCLTYRPSHSGDKDQTLVFCLETQGSDFVIQGVSAKRTIGGWAAAMPPRASSILNMTNSPEILRKIMAAPGWCRFLGGPALAITGIVWLGALWVLYGKMGRMASASLVPVYNLWVLADVGGRPAWLSLLIVGAVAPMLFGGAAMYGAIAVAAVIMLFISLGVAGELNKGLLFGLGLWILPAVFYPILAATTES